MVRRKGELSSAMIDVGSPHQVALPAEACAGKNWVVTHEFCRDLSLCVAAIRFAGIIAIMLCSALPNRQTRSAS